MTHRPWELHESAAAIEALSMGIEELLGLADQLGLIDTGIALDRARQTLELPLSEEAVRLVHREALGDPD